jgi:hypothetical protein
MHGTWSIRRCALSTLAGVGSSFVDACLRDLARPSRAIDPSKLPETIDMTVIVVGTLQNLMVYPFVQKCFTKGVSTGAIKG